MCISVPNVVDANMLKGIHDFVDRRWVLLVGLVFLLGAFYLIFTNGSMAIRNDNNNHLYKAKHQPLDSLLQGWNLQYFGGYSDDIYPNGYHWILKLFLTFLSDTQALQILTFLLIALQTLGVWALVTRLYSSEIQRRIAFVLGLLSIGLLEPAFLASLTASVYVGGGPALLGFTLFLFATALFVKPIRSVRQVLLGGILIGLTLLVHTPSAVVLLLVVFWQFILFKGHRKGIFQAVLLGLLIASAWIWVAINPDFYTSRVNMSGTTEIMSLFILLALGLYLSQKSARRSPLTMPIVILALFSVVPTRFSDLLWAHGLVGIHFYRFAIFAIFLLALHLPKFVRLGLLARPAQWVLLGALLGSLLIANTYSRVVAIDLDTQELEKLDGRILDISPHVLKQGIPNTLPYILTEGRDLVASEGGFFESSELGILFYSLETLVSPSGFTGGVNTRLLRRYFGVAPSQPLYKIDPEKAQDVLGVNWYVSTTTEKMEDDKDKIMLGQIIEKYKRYLIPVNIYAVQASPSPLIEALGYLPEKSNQDFRRWWLEASMDNLFLIDSPNGDEFQEFVDKNEVVLDRVEIKDIKVGRDWISYEVEKQGEGEYIPVFVKFAYNRYFNAVSEGENVPIARVSPGYMLVPSRGEVFIQWKMPQPLALLEKLSIVALLGSVGGYLAILILAKKGKGTIDNSIFRGLSKA